MKKFSVIIPIYNAAETLHRCLDSLVPQLREDSELLIVNDGSTDASLEICAEYISRCPQIRLFSKENGGVSSARNLGLDHAQGEYVLFVDSDDAVNPGYFDVLESALKDQPELLMFGVQVFRGAQCTCRHPCEKQTMIEGSACASALSTAMRRQQFNLITTKAFRRDIIQVNQIRFEESLDIGEDKVFSFAYAVCITNVCCIPDILYRLYMDRSESLSRKTRNDLLASVLLEHDVLLDILGKANLAKQDKTVYNKAVQYSFYRSAYTVCRKEQARCHTNYQKNESAIRVLRMYSMKKRFQPTGAECFLVALPIRKRWKRIVNLIVSFFPKEESK